MKIILKTDMEILIFFIRMLPFICFSQRHCYPFSHYNLKKILLTSTCTQKIRMNLYHLPK